ncbi:MAG: zinc-ribbon domain-containing protein [Candidatus Heimdallarchaeaceae archaeon]
MSDYIYCPYCGARNSAENHFCESCGQKIVSSRIESSPSRQDSTIGPYQQTSRGCMSGSYDAVPTYPDPNVRRKGSGVPTFLKIFLGLIFFFVPFIFFLIFFVMKDVIFF